MAKCNQLTNLPFINTWMILSQLHAFSFVRVSEGWYFTKQLSTWCRVEYKTKIQRVSTRSSANAEEPCERTFSWNRVECCTNDRRIAFEKACNLWMTFKVNQGHGRCCHLRGHIYYFLLVFHCKYISILHRFRDINSYLPKNYNVTWSWPRPSGGKFVVMRQTLLGSIRAQRLTMLSSAIPEKFKGV